MEMIERLLGIFFRHQIVIKMFHFQTKYYGAHKASDTYLDKFNSNFDQFMEVAQGRYGRITARNINLNVSTASDENIISELDDLINLLSEMERNFANIKELLAIRDTMMADAQQFKYLLTFK